MPRVANDKCIKTKAEKDVPIQILMKKIQLREIIQNSACRYIESILVYRRNLNRRKSTKLLYDIYNKTYNIKKRRKIKNRFYCFRAVSRRKNNNFPEMHGRFVAADDKLTLLYGVESKYNQLYNIQTYNLWIFLIVYPFCA